MRLHFHLFVGLFLPAFAVAARAESSDVPASPELTEVRNYIVSQIDSGVVPSIAVAVVKNDKVIWAEGFGYANIEKKAKATSDSIYLMASVSKPMTATGLMVLKDRGLIDLDRPANAYLPGEKLRSYAGSADDMTIRRLANHTAGMPTHYSFFYDSVAPPPMNETIRRHGFASMKPGTEYNYSNLAFGVLNYITEVVSKTPWSEFMEKNVYDVIGMTRSSDHVRPGHAEEATVQYTRGASGEFIPVAPYDFDHRGASAIWTSAADLARFMRMHLNTGTVDGVRLLKEETAKEMREAKAKDAKSPVGIAWFTDPRYDHKCFSHSGGMPGVSTLITGYPDDGLATIALVNADSSGLASDVSGRIAKALLADVKIEPTRPSPPKDESTGSSIAGKWVGQISHYAGDIPVELVCAEDEPAQVRLGTALPARRVKLENFKSESEKLSGKISGVKMNLQESYHGPVALILNLRREGDRLLGTAFAVADAYFGISLWVELRQSE